MIHTTTGFPSRLAVLAGIALLALACGGGGPDSPTALSPSSSVAEVEYDSFQLANSARENSGVKPMLELDEAVSEVARQHSRAMRDQGFFGHNGPDGDLGARLRRAGVAYSVAGENLAMLTSSGDPAAQAHAMFLDSIEHREVMLDSRFRLAGVGVTRSGDNYWLTQIYIRP